MGSGSVTFNGPATISANAGGGGANSGGGIGITATTAIVFPSPNNVKQLFSANGSGTGDGGFIQFVSLTGDIALGGGTTGPQFSATGGFSGSAGGNGGTIWILDEGGNLTIPSNGVINVTPLGNVGKWRHCSLGWFTGATENLNIAANAASTGTGGNVVVEIQGLNASGSVNVNGNISANGGTTSGDGGSITVVNYGPINPGVNGGVVLGAGISLTANATSGNGGSITVDASNPPAGPVTFNGATTLSANAGGTGAFNGGNVSVLGSSIALTSGAPAACRKWSWNR